MQINRYNAGRAGRTIVAYPRDSKDSYILRIRSMPTDTYLADHAHISKEGITEK